MPAFPATPLLFSGPVDAAAVATHVTHLAGHAGCSADALDTLQDFLAHPLTQAILRLPPDRLDSLLLNDVYKPRMHSLYATCLPGVEVTFALHVRRTPMPLSSIRAQDPELWSAFLAACSRRLTVSPYPAAVLRTLRQHFHGFHLPEAALQRADAEGVAPVQWAEAGGELTALATGHAEAASHVETTLTQLVQEVTIAAQVRKLQRQGGSQAAALTPELLLTSALVQLAAGVERLNAEVGFHGVGEDCVGEAEGTARSQKEAAESGEGDGSSVSQQQSFAHQWPKIALFAGRRSSSRRFLLLQNWFCRRHLRGFAGTSATAVTALLDALVGAHPPGQVQFQEAVPQQAAQLDINLVGTLAHEVVMVVDQLLHRYNRLPPSPAPSELAAAALDQREGTSPAASELAAAALDQREGTSPAPYEAQICALLAHLLMLRAAGGVDSATALADTFGTAGFVAAALAARLPLEFVQDMKVAWGQQWAAQPACCTGADAAVVFDLFRVWRVDSGDFAQVATLIVDAWEQRWSGTAAAERPPRPLLMHSNLSSYGEVVAVSHMPARIRPSFLCFGTLADGFGPLPLSLEPNFDQTALGNVIHIGRHPPPTGNSSSKGGGGGSPSLRNSSSSGGNVAAAAGMDTANVKPSKAAHPMVQVQLASIVMKAVQAQHGNLPSEGEGAAAESAGKLGDDVGGNKVQMDPRLSAAAQARTRARMQAMAGAWDVPADAASAALAAAYRAVTREGILA